MKIRQFSRTALCRHRMICLTWWRNSATECAPCPACFLACGQQDSLYPANLRLRDTLQAMNWPLTWYEAPGDHNWFFWNDALGRAMKELLEN